jgi:glycosyltransferase involved in cell wall biosynthesis
MPRVTFVMEQHIGHQTYYQNVRRAVESDGRIAATWAPVTYTGASRLVDRIPALPRGLRGTLHGAVQARAAIRGAPYDVAFFNTQVPAALVGPRLRQRPYVLATDITPVQYDGMSHLYGHTPDRFGPLAAYKHRANCALFQSATRLLPWSSWTAESLIKDYGVMPERVDVVPPGVDLQRWQPGAAVSGERLRILFVGGDLYRKGGDTLLKAFRALPAESAELHIVTRTRIEPETGVRVYYDLKPNSPELMSLYQSSHVFALPTAAEAFGIAAIEAGASGLATIATAVGGLVDIVADGETGYLIPAGDVVALRERLVRLTDDEALRMRLGRAARARAEQRFDAQRNAERIVAHLLEAAAAGRQTSVSAQPTASRR